MKKQQGISNKIGNNREIIESKIKGKLIKTVEKNEKLIKDEKSNERSELSAFFKNKSKEKEERKRKKQENEKKKDKEEKRATTTNSRDKLKIEEKSNKKKEEESVYEDDFEEYESDFEEDLDENEKSKDVRLDEAKEEESFLRKKLAGNERIKKNEKDERTFESEQREFAVSQEVSRRSIQEDNEPKKETETNKHEWFADYFKEVTGQNEHRKQSFTQTEGPELCAYSQTESVESKTLGTQTKRYSNNSRGLETKQNNELACFVEEAGQLMIGLLQSSSSNFEKISSLFSARRLTLSFNSLFTENSTENRLLTIAYKNPQTICICIFVAESNDPMKNKMSFIAEFDIEATNQEIRRLLCCNQEVVFLRYSPDSSVLFGALKDGSLIAWDLLKWRSSMVSETTLLVGGVLKPVMSPNFIFGSVSEEQWKTNNPNWADLRIIGMEVADIVENLGSRAIARLYSLYESGLLRILHTMATDRGKNETRGNGEVDGKIELVVISSLYCFTHNGTGGHKSYSNEFATSFAISENHEGEVKTIECFIGTSRGRIIRLDPTNIKTSKFYYSSQIFQGFGSEITTIKFPCYESSMIFACATNNQRIFIFNHNEYEPIKVLSVSTAMRGLGPRLMSSTLFECDENVFYSIKSGEQVLIWKSDIINDGMGKTNLIGTYDFYQQFRTRIQCSTIWKTASGNTFMALGLANGEVQVHELNKI